MILALGAALCLCRVPAEEVLQVEKAYFGASGSWRDVTAFLQSHLRGDALSLDISQPFETVGGDPAPGDTKHLIIDYRFNGQPFRLLLEEQYPVAFPVSLPSDDAAPPGKDPKASEIMKQIKAKPVPVIGTLWQRWAGSAGKFRDHYVSWLALGVSVLALACACTATLQARQIKRESQKTRSAA